MNDFIFYDCVYSENEIIDFEKIYSEAKWSRVQSSPDYNVGDRDWISVTPQENMNKVIDTYLDYIPELSANEVIPHIVSCGGHISEAKITRYGKGDQYSWHSDCFIAMPNQICSRQISSITYLNDDFEGGETEFYDGSVIIPAKGKTLIFPSNWCFVHRGRPVVSGEKYILVHHFWV
jgi:predicted 2-oxoglutarate/Fe(II)-dependent dioxygenase YbiX